jgi:putative nucleotidyltransferase with HDIG domain
VVDQLDIQVLLEKLERLPSLPSVAIELLSKIQDNGISAEDIASLIEKDQGLTLQILKLSNSAFYRRAQPVETVKDAVVSVGLDAVKMMVLSVSILKTFENIKGQEGPGFDPRRFWLHSLACATGARIVCASKYPNLAEVAFVAGLLHDIGKTVLNELVPDLYAKVISAARSQHLSALEAERKKMDVDHVVVGNLLAEKWNLPETLRDAIWMHHQPSLHRGSEEARFVLSAVHVADWICNHYGLSVDPESGWTAADTIERKRLGLTPVQIYQKLREELRESVSIFDEVMPSQDLMLDVLQKSNRQLGKLSQKVQQTVVSLKGRNLVMGHLAEMGENLQSLNHLTDIAQAIVAGTLKGVDADATALQMAAGKQRLFEATARRTKNGTAKTEINIINRESGKGLVVSEDWIEGDRIKLAAGGRVLGHLTAWFDPERASPHPQSASDMTFFAQMGAPALERARLNALRDEKLAPVAPGAQGKPEAPLEPSQISESEYQLLKEVMAAIGHEFNNLLTGVLGQAEILKMHEEDPVKSKRLQSIETAATDAAELIARYRGKFGKALSEGAQNVADLEQATRDVLELQEQKRAIQAGDRKIGLEVQPSGPWLALGNTMEIKEVITNLLLNALDATEEKGQISVTVGSQGDSVFVRVQDTGQGISPQTLSQIFDPFFTTKKGQGTGIGLTISRNIMRNHGGDLKVSSTPGQGSIFEARLPRWKGEISKDDSQEETMPIGRKSKALLVEDNERTRDTVQDMLQSLGIKVEPVTSPTSIEETLRDEVYDFVITNLHLKDTSAAEVVQSVKEAGLTTPVLLITGEREEGEQKLIDQVGPAAVLFKPFTVRQLSSALNKILITSAPPPRVARSKAQSGGPSKGASKSPSKRKK